MLPPGTKPSIRQLRPSFFIEYTRVTARQSREAIGRRHLP